MVVDVLKSEPKAVSPGDHYVHEWCELSHTDLVPKDADDVPYKVCKVVIRRLKRVTYNEQGERFENERLFAVQDVQLDNWIQDMIWRNRDLNEALNDKDLALSKALKVARDCMTMNFWQRLKFLFTGKAPTWM